MVGVGNIENPATYRVQFMKMIYLKNDIDKQSYSIVFYAMW